MRILKRLFLSVIILSVTVSLSAQTGGAGFQEKYSRMGINAISTAVPFITIAPDARTGAMADVGASTSPDANSMHWNPAKYAFADKPIGIALNYTPWMRGIGVSDINLFNVAGYYKINDKSAVAATLTYFSLGEVDFTDENNKPLGTVKPNEFAIDATYSRKFSEKISGAVAGRFIFSDLAQGIHNLAMAKAGTSVAADIALYYVEPIQLGEMDAEFALGVNISNLGSKMSYEVTKDKKEFIPANLRIGPSLKMNIDDYNSIFVGIDLNKLLVPTPPMMDPTHEHIAHGRTNEVDFFKGMIQSFYDAPGYVVNPVGKDGIPDTVKIGTFREELQEINLAIGAEWWYNKLLAVRAGYSFEHPRKGDRQFITVGAGLRYNIFGIDLSYLVALRRNSPLENTLRVSLILNFGS